MNNPRPSVIVTRNYPEPLIEGNNLKCSVLGCLAKFKTYALYDGHVDQCHQCSQCGLYCVRKDLHICHHPGERRGHVDQGGGAIDQSVFQESRRSHHGVVKDYTVHLSDDFVDIEDAFASIESAAERILRQLFELQGTLLVEICATVKMERDDPLEDGLYEIIQDTMYFRSKHVKLLSVEEIRAVLYKCIDVILERKNNYVNLTSRWTISRVESFDIKVAEYRLLHRMRPSGYLPMPFKKKKYGVVNLKNTDDKCFQYTVCMALFYEEQKQKNEKLKLMRKRRKKLENWQTWRDYVRRLDMTGLENGVDIFNNLGIFESKNDLRITILSHDKDNVILHRQSNYAGNENTRNVHLFLIKGSVDGDGFQESHFCWIKNLNMFNSHLMPRHTSFMCPVCIHRFSSQKALDIHSADCNSLNSEEIKYELPAEGDTLKFRKHQMTLKHSHVGVFDFECFTVPAPSSKNKNAKTKYVGEFKPASYALAMIDTTGEVPQLVDGMVEYYDGENILETFLERVLDWSHQLLLKNRETNNPPALTADQLERHKKADKCDFCQQKFTVTEEQIQEYDFDNLDVELSEEEILAMLKESRVVGQQSAKSSAGTSTGNPIGTPTDTSTDIPTEKKPKRLLKTLHHHHQSWNKDQQGVSNYQYTLCHICNLNCASKQEIVFYAYGSRFYDTHLIISALNSAAVNASDVKVIAKTQEQYVSVTISAKDKYLPPLLEPRESMTVFEKFLCGRRKVRARFCDANSFLSGPLSSVTETLRREGHPYFNLILQAFPYLFGDTITPTLYDSYFLCCKLPFCYRFLSDPSVLADSVGIPSREFFNNDMTGEAMEDHEWELLEVIESTFNIKSFRQLLRLYNVVDTLLCGICILAFRDKCYDYYGLDLCYSNTLASFGWQSCLFTTELEIDYIRDFDQLDMISRGVRGGVSGCTTKVVQARHEEIPGEENSADPSVIASFDVVSLYATVLRDYRFGVSDYITLDAEAIKNIDWTDDKIYQDLDYGYIVEVSLEYPKETHDFSSDLPYCPEKRMVELNELGSRQQQVVDGMGAKGRAFLSQPKLLTTQYDKDNYVLHFLALRYYLQSGLRLKKVHAAIRFRQKPIFQKFIAMNIEMRKQATTEFSRQTLKLISNTVFGMTLRSNKKQTEIKFANNKIHARKLLADGRLKSWKILNDNLTMYILHPKRVYMNNPIWCGMTVLDISKVILYTSIYNNCKGIWGDRFRVCGYDTDGFVAQIKVPLYKFIDDIVDHRQFFDLSKLPRNCSLFVRHKDQHPELYKNNASESGLIKLEMYDIKEAIFLKSKVYSIQRVDNSETIKLKGVTEIAKKQLRHNMLKSVALDPKKTVNVNMKYFKSEGHIIYILDVDKVALTHLDVYRCYWDANDINSSLPFGNWQLRQCIVEDECNGMTICLD